MTAMELNRFPHRQLSQPQALVAFSGWGDGGEASSSAQRYVLGQTSTEVVATIDPEGFYDFQMKRPTVFLDQQGYRSLDWPETKILLVQGEHISGDLLLIQGAEPNYRWRQFVKLLTDLLLELGTSRVVTMGAFVGQVPHTLPVPLIGTASDPTLIPRHHLFRSGYEGPTGIVGVLNVALTKAEIETISVWAAVPHYVSNQEYSPGALALLRKAAEILEIEVDTSKLEEDSKEFLHTVDAAIDSSHELAEYVADLEEETNIGEVEADPGELVEEIERFLQENQT